MEGLLDKILFFFGTSNKHFNEYGKVYLGEITFVLVALLFVLHAGLFLIAYVLCPFAGLGVLNADAVQFVSQLIRIIAPIFWLILTCFVANEHGIGWSWVNKRFQRENGREDD